MALKEPIPYDCAPTEIFGERNVVAMGGRSSLYGRMVTYKKYLHALACLLFMASAPMASSQSVDELFKKGNAAQKEGDYELAISCWNAVLKITPKDAVAYFNRGNAKKAKSDLDGAIADYNRALALDPKDAVAYNNRGIAKQAKGDLGGAIADYDRAIELDPKYADACTNRGSAKQAKGDLDGAIADCNRAIALDPKDAVAYNNRGNAKQAKSDLDVAIADYNRAIALDPKYAAAYFNRANAEQAKSDLDGAIADYSQVIKLDPENVVTYHNRGYAKIAKDDLAGAIADYNRVVALDPKYAPAYFHRGLAEALMRNWKDALSDFQHCCEMAKRNQDYPRIAMWLIRARLGETDAASKDLAAYFDKRPSTVSGDWVSKVAGYLLGRVSEADLFAASSSPDPKEDAARRCEAWFYAGMKKLLAGDKKTAADYFHKCVATEQKNLNEFQLARSELKTLE